MSKDEIDGQARLLSALSFYFHAAIDAAWIQPEFDKDQSLIANFMLTSSQLAKMFCFAGMFDAAKQARLIDDPVRLRVDSSRTCHQEGIPDDLYLTDKVVEMFERAFRRHYDYAARVVKYANSAIEGPGELIVWSKQAGSICVEITVQSDEDSHIGDLFTSGLQDENWISLVNCLENPYYLCTTSVNVEDHDLGHIGHADLSLCSIPTDTSSDRFTWSILKDYGSYLLKEAVQEARTKKPKAKKAAKEVMEVNHG